MTEVTPRDHEASLISPTIEAEGTWKLVKNLLKIILLVNNLLKIT